MAHCEAEALALRFLAGELEGPDKERYRSHLTDCRECQTLVTEELAFADSLIFSMAAEPPPRQIFHRLEQRVDGARHLRWPISWVGLVAGAALIIGLGLGHALGASQARAALPQPSNAHVVLGLDAASGRPTSGEVVVWTRVDRIMISVNHLKAPPSGEVYEVWTISGVGPKSLGNMHWNHGRAWFSGRAVVNQGDQIVVCAESRTWEGEWLGPIALSATMPNT